MTDVPAAPDAAPEKPEPKRRFRVTCLGLCAGLFLLLILLWGGIKGWMVYALHAEQKALRAAGEPVTWQEVIDSIEPIPDAENSALVLQPHLDAIAAGRDAPIACVVCGRERPPLGARPSEEMLKLMRTYLSKSEASLEVIHEAAKRPRGRWPVDTNPHTEEHDSSYLSGVRHAGYTLMEEADLCATDGDGHGAALAARALRRLGASLDANPSRFGAGARCGLGKWAVAATERALALGKLPAEDMAMLRSEFATEEQQLSLHVQLAARAERASHLWLSTEGRRFITEWRPRGKALVIRRVMPGCAEMDVLTGLNYDSELVDLFALPAREILAGLAPVAYRYIRESASWKGEVFFTAFGGSGDGIAPLIHTSVPARQHMHVARAALAVEQFRMERGRWPEKLADLVPDYLDAVPQDWFAPKGVTISYGRTPTGVRIWSCAEDNHAGLTSKEAGALSRLAEAIREAAGSTLPESLDELVPKHCEAIPIDPRTGKPYTYVTNPANPDLFILGGITGGKTEDAFWKQTISTLDCARRHSGVGNPLVFRLLNPELRGVKQVQFADEVDALNSAYDLRALGYTPERLKELGFSDVRVESYKDEVKQIEEWEREEAADELERENPEQSDPPAVPSDTQTEATP